MPSDSEVHRKPHHPERVNHPRCWTPNGRDVLASMVWIPLVTFWQVTADLPLSTGVPDGFGHNCHREILDGWVTVLHPAAGAPTRLSSYETSSPRTSNRQWRSSWGEQCVLLGTARGEAISNRCAPAPGRQQAPTTDGSAVIKVGWR
jgi:Alpha/beta-hydrolase family